MLYFLQRNSEHKELDDVACFPLIGLLCYKFDLLTVKASIEIIV